MLLKPSWLLCKVLVLRIKSKKGKDFLLLKDFYYFITFIPPVFFCWKMPYLFLPAECFCADTVLSTWTKAANCTSGWAMCVCCRRDETPRFWSEVLWSWYMAQQMMPLSVFMGPHFLVPNFFWLLQLEHFSNAVWDINTIFLGDCFPTRILWPLWTSESPSISNVQLLLTNSSLTPVLLGSKKTLCFCNAVRNCLKNIQRVKIVNSLYIY